MSLLYNLKIASYMRNEQKRIENLDWNGLEKHLKEYFYYFLENQVFPHFLMSIKTKEPAVFNELKEIFEDTNFELKIEQYLFGMLYHGWSVGADLLNEQFPEERKELNEGLEFIKRDYGKLLKSKGINNEFILNCFSTMRQQMFEIGREHGKGPEFFEFRPRRSVHIPK